MTDVEELEAPEEEEEGEDNGKDPDLTEPEVEKVIFKFRVLCEDKPGKKKEKAKSQ